MKIKIIIILSLFLITGFYCGCIENQDDLQIIFFTIDPQIVDEGETVTLRWMVDGATNVSINNGIGYVNLTGNKVIVVNDTTTFILTAKNNNKNITASVKVIVKSQTSDNLIIIDDELYDDAPRDRFDIDYLIIINDTLKINVSYSGGCGEHDFYLILKEHFMESEPVQILCVLSHKDYDDPCDSIVTDSLIFDLTLLKLNWQQEYKRAFGRIIIILENYSEPILYVFEDENLSFLNITLKSDKTQYKSNENISINISVTNNYEKNVTLSCTSSKVADFEVLNEQGERVYLWSHDKVFAQWITHLKIPAGETIKMLTEKWDQFDNNGLIVPLGNYTIRGWITGSFYFDDFQYDYSPIINVNCEVVITIVG